MIIAGNNSSPLNRVIVGFKKIFTNEKKIYEKFKK